MRSMLFSALQNSRCLTQLKGNQIVQSVSYASKRGRNSSNPVVSIANKHSKEGLKPGLCVDGKTELSKWVFETERLSDLKKQQITTEEYVRKNNIPSSKPRIVKPDELLGEEITASSGMHVNEPKASVFEGMQHHGVQQKVMERNIQRLLTILLFDIETTGFSREKDRIIEIAIRDLCGGLNSTFQTLINPDCYVPNPHIHGISTNMVSRPNVPRFEDLIPILLHYVESRRIPDTPIVLVGHNSRTFDLPFLISEFSRCSIDIPSDWRFFDTLPIAREMAKLEGTKNLAGVSLQALREYYGIPLVGTAHNAMSDVHTLGMVLKEMTHDLKLTPLSLLERSFTASDVVNTKKKKKSKS